MNQQEMRREFTRSELHELVWSQPLTALAKQFGISNVAVAKTCRKANIPVPERGYWARKRASRPTVIRSLPLRFPGAPDTVSIGGGPRWDYGWQETSLEEPIPTLPAYDEELDAVRERIRKMVGKVRCPRDFTHTHPLIAKLLAQDEERRADFLRTGWDCYALKYEKGIERRRLIILNAILTHLQRLECKPDFDTSIYANQNTKDRVITARVGRQHLSFTLEPVPTRARKPTDDRRRQRLRLTLGSSHSSLLPETSWEDADGAPLESLLTDIVVSLLVRGEASYRQGVISHRDWLIERKAELEEQIRQRKADEEREAREVLEREEQERIDLLLSQATQLHHAETIRAYVQLVRSRKSELPNKSEDLDRWATWALGEADRIDPVKNGAVIRAAERLSPGPK